MTEYLPENTSKINRSTLRTIALILVISWCVPPSWIFGQVVSQPRNVLFIAVDDLRPDLGCYGATQVKSPQIDRLAARGMGFQQAYCQSAICAPSRASLLTGLRPDRSGVNDLFTSVRKQNPDIVTLPQLFKNNGYKAVSFGKVYHNSPLTRDSLSWSEREWSARAGVGRGYLLPENQKLSTETPSKTAAPYEMADVPDTAYGDGLTALRAIEWLQENKDQPFFLAVGFDRPHLPFNAPKKYWDLYDTTSIAVPQEVLQGIANNAIDKSAASRFPEFSNGWGELAQYAGIDRTKPVPVQMAKMLRWGYYASISYMDAQVGRLLDALDTFGLREHTLIVLWGDHGYKLGEYGAWCKHTNLEIDTRAPLIIALPEGGNPGTSYQGLAEFIDIYPTLAQWAGLPLPAHLQGKSLLKVLKEPATIHKRAAFSQFSDWNGAFRGYSIRTQTHRYTVWISLAGADKGNVVGRECYDHRTDPEERQNLAGQAKMRSVERKLMKQLIKENDFVREGKRFVPSWMKT